MGQTITFRPTKKLAGWIEQAAAQMGVSPIWSRLGKAIGPLRSSFGSPESSVTDPAISQPVRGFRKNERYRGYRLSGCIGQLGRRSSRVGNARFRTGYRAASYVRARAGRDGVSSAQSWAGSGDALGRFPYAFFRLRRSSAAIGGPGQTLCRSATRSGGSLSDPDERAL